MVRAPGDGTFTFVWSGWLHDASRVAERVEAGWRSRADRCPAAESRIILVPARSRGRIHVGRIEGSAEPAGTHEPAK